MGENFAHSETAVQKNFAHSENYSYGVAPAGEIHQWREKACLDWLSGHCGGRCSPERAEPRALRPGFSRGLRGYACGALLLCLDGLAA